MRIFRQTAALSQHRRYAIPFLILTPLILGNCDWPCGGSVTSNPLPGFTGPYKVKLTGTVKAGVGGYYELAGGTADITCSGDTISWTGTNAGDGAPDPGKRKGTAQVTVTPDRFYRTQARPGLTV